MSIERRGHRDCVGCPCFLKNCIAVIYVNGHGAMVYDVCCRSCGEGHKALLEFVRVSVG